MTFEEYQKEAVSFRSETANNEEYLTLGLIEEVGEAAGKLAKRRRDGVFDVKAFVKELGDILWFVANLADYYDKYNDWDFSAKLKGCFGEAVDYSSNTAEVEIVELAEDAINFIDGVVVNNVVIMISALAKRYGYTLEQVAEINLAKLRDRAARGQIQGNGDER